MPLYNEKNQCRIGVPTYKKTYLLISIAYTRVSFSWTIDTGHFFHTSPAQGLVFWGIPKGQESKSWVVFEGPRRFWGPQKQERKNNQNSIIFWAKNKMRRNFIWGKLMEFLLFYEVLKISIFFQSLIKKFGVITVILGKF